ncbi:MAG: SpoIID/LytB domain-containing protein [Parachlamydiaceae bacterium]|nr:SpoIID/LytB domain-containing protein [Parachlamydiaceae bacterium]
MFSRIFLLFLTIVLFGSGLEAGLWDNLKNMYGKNKQEIPTIQVLLVHDVEGVNLEVKGKYSLYDPYAKSYISSRFVGKSKKMEALRDGLKWGESFPGLYQLRIQPDEASTYVIIDNDEYSGPVSIYDVGGTISIVNQLPIEEFVRDVLSNLPLNNWHPELVSALAIVARTNAYYQAANPRTTFWALDAKSVGFKGNPSENEQSNIAKEAVRLTRNMVMSRTGVYERVATPFPAELGPIGSGQFKNAGISQITIDEANQMAKNGEHAAQILGKAFPGTTIMLSP